MDDAIFGVERLILKDSRVKTLEKGSGKAGYGASGTFMKE